MTRILSLIALLSFCLVACSSNDELSGLKNSEETGESGEGEGETGDECPTIEDFGHSISTEF